jgi:putative adenylate-forming enzyme
MSAKGIPQILWHYVQTRSRRFRTREELLAWQDRQVQRHLKRILPHSAYYRERLAPPGSDPLGPAPLGLEQWRDWPTIDKAEMMRHFDRLNTVGVRAEEAFHVALEAERSRDFAPMLGSITVGLSSGTSGNRGLFLVSPSERFRWAGTMLARLLPGSILDKNRVAFFLRANSNLYETVGSSRIRFEFFDLMEPLDAHVARLNRFQPTVLIGPPSLLRLLAEHAGLAIAPVKVVSVAEVLDPLDELCLKERFGPVVHQVYQCTEGFLGVTCSHGTLHLNEDLVAFQREVLDAENRKFIPILTDFSRTTQPIIRYRLNDILTERAEPCPCGSVMTALERIEGRSDDLFYFAATGAERLVPVFPDFIRRAVMEAAPEAIEYRVCQHSEALVEVSLRLPPEPSDVEARVATRMAQLADELGAQPPAVTFTAYEAHRSDRKLRRVERRFTP